MNEHEIQRAVVKYIRRICSHAMMTATLGGVKMNVRQVAKAKSDGYMAGVPDLLVFERRGNYCGLALEIKTETGGPSLDQSMWCIALQMRGWYAEIVYGLDEAIAHVNKYFQGGKK